jgi:carbamate kinase
MPSAPDSSAMNRPVLVLALGGNAISRAGDEPSVGAQFRRMREAVEGLVGVIRSGAWRLVITHGNGPQVGNIMLRSDLAAEAGALPPIPMDAAVADTQGAMGYMIGQCLGNALWESGLQQPVATVVTQIIVDENDPAFSDPTKPVGRLYPHDAVEDLRGRGWSVKADPQGGGWRRVVPSPEPLEIVEVAVVAELLQEGVIVIACGGGGIPVASSPTGALHGVEAVIDKDMASGLLASHLKADTLAILTDVDRVYLHFGTEHQLGLGDIDVGSLRRRSAEGHFAAGSMGPKVEAAARFVERGGSRAIITDTTHFEEALGGSTGTHITPAAPPSRPGGEGND